MVDVPVSPVFVVEFVLLVFVAAGESPSVVATSGGGCSSEGRTIAATASPPKATAPITAMAIHGVFC